MFDFIGEIFLEFVLGVVFDTKEKSITSFLLKSLLRLVFCSLLAVPGFLFLRHGIREKNTLFVLLGGLLFALAVFFFLRATLSSLRNLREKRLTQ